jgi:hypothetical protein
MAVTDPKSDPKSDPKPATAKPAAPLARASESGDPAVQKLLADRQAAQMNREALQATDDEAVAKLNADIKAADEQVDAVNKQLADLGYE